MRPKDSARDPSVDISALRQLVEHATQQARSLAERYEKNSGIQECLIFLQRALASISDEDESWPEPVNVDWTEFGKILKHRRQQARLGQKEVADLVDVSESMIRFVEAAQKRPSRKLLLRLLALPALNLNLDDLVSPTDQDGVIPTLWLAPHYDPHQLITEFVERLNGSGCSLEQTSAYLDYSSSAGWLATSNTPSYLAQFSNLDALAVVAERIAEKCGAGGLDVIALGCGDARREVKLIEYLIQHAERRNIKDIRVFLLDISHMLLTEGHNYAKEKLGGSVRKIFALHGNFHDLAQYPLFSQGDMRTRCRVFTLLGCTLANLDNEVRFFRDTMNAAAAGDFFIADYSNACAPPEQPDRIRELDPPIRAGVLATHKDWLGGPILRHSKGVRSVELSIELNTDCIVRGSYELVYVANAMLEKGLQSRRFVVFRFRRYDPAQLEDCLSRSGWSTEIRTPYGGSDRSKLTLMLLRKGS